MIIEKSHVGFRVTVPCKLNLYLDVLGKRTDGYHSLDTVMMAVSLVDELSIVHRDDDLLQIDIEFADGAGRALDGEDPAWRIPADHHNLIIRALDRLRKSLGKPYLGAQVKLTKRIPAMAGLGGGSANAAAALVLGYLLWTTQNDLNHAHSLASELGSDINFFLESHCNRFWLARCSGRGEIVEPLPCAKLLHFVMVHPPRGCVTKDVFSALGAHFDDSRFNNPNKLIQALKEGDLQAIGGGLRNGLETAAAATNIWIDRSRSWIDRYDHHGQSLSGSGSARFCLCESHEQAEKIATEISLHGDMRAFCLQSWQSPGIAEQINGIRDSS
ncbi:MAG: 4-(cytidine 5'-diphospho)-2-C-methyl-D-erythritol kinase [Pirellula sp.]